MICYIREFTSSNYKRNILDDVKQTGKSFRNWDSCMNDKPCKIIAIVGICLAGVLGLWLIGALLTCCRQGFTGIFDCFFWCCARNRPKNSITSPPNVNQGQSYQVPPNVVYQPVQAPVHDNRRDVYFENDHSYGNNSEVYEIEQDFNLDDYKKKSEQKNKKTPYPKNDVTYY